MDTLFRRMGLGSKSCNGISRFLLQNHGKDITIVRNDNIPDISFTTVIRWGCTSAINSERIINPAKPIYRVTDKRGFRLQCQESGISVPKSWGSKDEILNDQSVAFPLIGRQSHHSQGRNLVVINDLNELIDDMTSEYWSEYIDKEREFRVYGFFGKVILVAEKRVTEQGRNEVAWNHALGNSEFINVRWSDWPLLACLEALKAHSLSGLDFSGVDIMTTDNDSYVLEINAAPSLTSGYRQRTFAKAFAWMFEIIEESGEKPRSFEVPTLVSSYRDIIHPAILH